LSGALLVSKLAFRGFASSLNWWMFGSVVGGSYLIVLVSLELYTDWRGPLVRLVRDLQLLSRDPGRCVKCGSRREWAQLNPDSRPLARNAVAICPTCQADASQNWQGTPSSYCPVCGGLLPANAYCLDCKHVVRDDS
jgi:hypothetical protein